MATQKTLGAKVKKKSFVPVMAPRMFGDILIGETPVTEAKTLVGKRISANFMQLTNDFKRQHITLRFAVSGISDGKAHTTLIGFEVAPSFVKRLVRRGRTKITDSFVVTSQDGVKARVKPIVVTQQRVSARTATMVRLSLKNQLADIAAKENFSSLATHFLDGSLQRHFRQGLSRIASLKHFEVKAFLADGGVTESDIPAVAESPSEEPAAEVSEEAPVEETQKPKRRAKKAAPADSEA